MWLKFLIVPVVLYVIWLAVRPRYEFQIRTGGGGTQITGRIAEHQQHEIVNYFRDIHLSTKTVTISGWRDDQQRLKLRFRGRLSPGERQMIRNYLLTVL
ncbi:hypothetical protein CA54_14940 [Symmachiella macrocystis]|uniref:Uncharacterized protein n=2 Tax=Symmachiella macrocystis TaxID=2527985 RepID=A0A5C6BKS8_9PLAN|nr:hypothetical protein CA54_14940 [Symmachiella macrocystis]